MSNPTSYKAESINSTISSYTFDDFFKNHPMLFGNGYIVLWQHHGVFVGRLQKDKEVQWLPYDKEVHEWTDKSNIVRIRAFDTTKEVHFWQNSKGLVGRLREDSKGDDVECVDTNMKLRSVVALPLTTNKIFNSDKLFLTTRNYIGYNSIGQAGYVDSRFVDFT